MERTPRRGAAAVVSELLLAYEGSGAAWARGPTRLYDRLADRVLRGVAAELAGALVLDVGAGTGALCRALRSCGATPVALDVSPDMLAWVDGAAVVSVTGDMLALPFIDNAFDAAVSGFALSHVDAPERALGEIARVVRRNGRVVIGVFGAAAANASKDVVDGVAARFGHRRPDWYASLKARTEPLSNTPQLLRACAEAGGLRSPHIDDITVDSGIETPEELVDYRIGMAHLAPFVRSLPPERREEFVGQAIAEVRKCGQVLRPRLLILSCRAPA